jgi:hypothetical protein
MSPKARVKFWKDETGQTMDYWFKRDSTTVIILDEMQLLYRYTEDRIWRLIKSVDGKRFHIKVFSYCFCSYVQVVCFAAYGVTTIRPAQSTPYNFRSATGLVSENTFISPDVGHMFGTTGMVDFYVNDSRKWAIEVLRDTTGSMVYKLKRILLVQKS